MDYKSPELTARVIIDNARDYIMLFMEKNNYDEGDFHPKVSLFNEYSPVLIITRDNKVYLKMKKKNNYESNKTYVMVILTIIATSHL